MYCKSPPKIIGAQAAHSFNTAIGDTVLYDCIKGYYKTDGDSGLKCILDVHYMSKWNGSYIHCTSHGMPVYSNKMFMFLTI